MGLSKGGPYKLTLVHNHKNNVNYSRITLAMVAD